MTNVDFFFLDRPKSEVKFKRPTRNSPDSPAYPPRAMFTTQSDHVQQICLFCFLAKTPISLGCTLCLLLISRCCYDRDHGTL